MHISYTLHSNCIGDSLTHECKHTIFWLLCLHERFIDWETCRVDIDTHKIRTTSKTRALDDDDDNFFFVVVAKINKILLFISRKHIEAI